MSTKKAAQGQKKGPDARSVCGGPFSRKLFYVILVMITKKIDRPSLPNEAVNLDCRIRS